MKSVNVKLQAPQDLLDTVIYPNQKARRLAPLILQLLEGYRDNAYIRQYVDGEITGVQSDLQQSLLDQLEEAENRLNAINYLNEVSGARAASSLEYFQSRLDAPTPSPAVSSPTFSSPEDLSSISQRISAIETTLAQLAQTMESIKGTTTTQLTPPPPSEPSPITAPSSSPNPPVLKSDDSALKSDPEPSSLDTSAADSFISSLF